MFLKIISPDPNLNQRPSIEHALACWSEARPATWFPGRWCCCSPSPREPQDPNRPPRSVDPTMATVEAASGITRARASSIGPRWIARSARRPASARPTSCQHAAAESGLRAAEKAPACAAVRRSAHHRRRLHPRTIPAAMRTMESAMSRNTAAPAQTAPTARPAATRPRRRRSAVGTAAAVRLPPRCARSYTG